MDEVEVKQTTILEDIKKLLNVLDDSFDDEILLHINGVISIFGQLWNTDGVTTIEKETIWDEYFNGIDFCAAKTLIYLKVKLIFDPPATSFAITAYEKQIADLEYRLIVQGDIEDEKKENDKDGT